MRSVRAPRHSPNPLHRSRTELASFRGIWLVLAAALGAAACLQRPKPPEMMGAASRAETPSEDGAKRSTSRKTSAGGSEQSKDARDASGENDGAVTESASAELQRLRELAIARSAAGSEIYRIGPGDLLEISVFDVPELIRKVRVGMNGEVQLPLIGAVRAEGKTEADLARDIAELLVSKRFVRSPQVDVFMNEYRSQQVAVTGAVAKPGLYALTRNRSTIFDMISEAGGLTKDAGEVIEFVPAEKGVSTSVFAELAAAEQLNTLDHLDEPGGDPSGKAIRLHLNDLLRRADRDVLRLAMMPGDVIFVPEAGSFTVEGWVDKPGVFPLGRKTTVLAALASANGTLFPARLGQVEILRDPNEAKKARSVIVVDVKAVRAGKRPDVPLQAGDIVRVPAWPFLLPPWGAYALVRDLVSVGASLPIL